MFRKLKRWPSHEQIRADECDITARLTQSLPVLALVTEHLAEPGIWDVNGAIWGHGGHWPLLVSCGVAEPNNSNAHSPPAVSQAQEHQRFLKWRESARSYSGREQWTPKPPWQ